jgi:large subunit ribosomal protein L25
MATVPFSASTRGTTGKGVARKLRAAGQVPAVIYGHARQSQPLALDHHTLTLFLEKHPYQSTVIALNVDGKTTNTLIREVQRHPYKKQILHVDFQELVAGETITVPVPLHFTGVPEGVRLGGGMLDQILHELELDCDPTNIPGHINVDVTSYLPAKHGYHGDTSATFYIGEPSEGAKKVVEVARKSLEIGLAQVKDGARIGDIAHRGPAGEQHGALAECLSQR